ncbi:hypothetical protein BJ912DRAFT_1065937 [Pholiota molesta]|nr:hypothetical protein BJ912DRAFT_1065937 [Pholiota molesta]
MVQQDSISSLITWLENEKDGVEHSKALKPYQHAARWIPVAIGPFISISAALLAGTARINHSELPPKMGEEDVLNFEMLSNACPGLKQALKAFKGDSSLVKCFVGHLSAAANSARAEDTSSCRKAVPAYILPSDHTDDDDLEKKSNRGWNNHYTARLLCPLKYLEEFDEDYDLFMGKVLDGTIRLKASQWPSFLYPSGAVYNSKCIDEGLFRGEVMLQFLRNICTGPTSARDGIRRASKPSKAEIHGMDHVFGRCVAYVAVQAYFSLSAIEHWSSSPQEGYFNLVDFFNRCVNLFESDPTDPWVVETLDCLTSELPSLKREYKGKQKRNISSTLGDDSDDDEAEAIYAQRAARRLQHLAANNASTNGVQEKLGSGRNALSNSLSAGKDTGSSSEPTTLDEPLLAPGTSATAANAANTPLYSPPPPVSHAAIRPVMSMSDSSDLSELEDDGADATPPPALAKPSYQKNKKKKKSGGS